MIAEARMFLWLKGSMALCDLSENKYRSLVREVICSISLPNAFLTEKDAQGGKRICQDFLFWRRLFVRARTDVRGLASRKAIGVREPFLRTF